MLSTGSTSSIGIAGPSARKFQQTAQRRLTCVLIVDEPRVLLEHLVLAAAGGVLQLEDRVRVEEVVFAVAPPLVLAAALEIPRAAAPRWKGHGVPLEDLAGDDVDADAADPRRRPREVLIDERPIEADRFEDLCATVALQRRDAHLGHHLQDALVQRVDVVDAPPRRE